VPLPARNRESRERLHNTRKNWLIFGSLAFFSLVFSLLAHINSRFPGDLQITLMLQSVNNDFLLSFTKGVTHLIGSWRTPLIVIVGGVALWLRVGRLEGLFVILSGATAFISDPLKEIIGRPRPTLELVNVAMTETGGSFPSGHTLFATLVFGMMMYLLAAHQRQMPAKLLTVAVCLFVIIFIGLSRVYLGVHWLSDVIGGLLIGSTSLYGLVWIYEKLKSRRLGTWSVK
jgi:membrane-associated phospholipid phosphatase